MLSFKTLIKRSSTLTLVSLGLAILVPACSGNTVLDPADYDHSCETAADCESVLVGDMCSCGCDWSAISKSDLGQFSADDDAARSACGNTGLTCVACPNPTALECTSGTCGFAAP